MRELAKEIAAHLGSDKRKDIDDVLDWLHEGNDDGSPVPTLADKYDMDRALPSRR